MSRKMSRRALGFAVAAFVAGAGGCGTRQFGVSGTVTYNKAVFNKPDGKIVFVGPGGAQVAADIGADGTYRATVTAGANQVAVYYPNPAVKADKTAKKNQPPPASSPPFLTPAKYASPDTSGLSVTVDKDTVFDVDMSD